jgi:hypothetical protein
VTTDGPFVAVKEALGLPLLRGRELSLAKGRRAMRSGSPGSSTALATEGLRAQVDGSERPEPSTEVESEQPAG